uniref:Uncharacterized protein n=1 Tax=Fagus sylvatica TaxID=28930 RepID=A0A2N9ENC2_FAGSY
MAKSEGDPQCVGRLEVVRPKPVGFLCGSIPIATDNSFHAFNSSALVPSQSPQTVSAPRYRMLPTETDLNTPPLLPNFPDKVLPIGAVHSKPTGGGTPLGLEDKLFSLTGVNAQDYSTTGSGRWDQLSVGV